ncbi:hypothetical protein HY440_01330 [Candidatus Microgenomates bacterium]|nr:hypothetical protein [Candidatus Microgenomates bacterium]
MRKLAKVLAVFALAVVVLATARAVIRTKAANVAYFRGFNTPFLAFDTAGNISSELNYLASACQPKVDTVRVFFPGAGIDNLKKTLDAAPAGLKFVITLSNFYINNEATGEIQQPRCNPRNPSECVQKSPFQWYSQGYKQSFRSFVDQVTKAFAGNPKVFMWEIMNEPNCDPYADCPGALKSFLSDVSTVIVTNDPGKLVSPGLQGQQVGGEKFGGEYEAITDLPNISANSCHVYPQIQPDGIANCLKAMDIVKGRNKVFYIGEAGWNVDVGSGCTAAPGGQLQNRVNELLSLEKIFTDSRKEGETRADGFLLWRFDPPQSGPQACDSSSAFPGDPICSASTFTYTNPAGSPDPKLQIRPGQANFAPVTYPPLGSLEECPSEIPVSAGTAPTNNTSGPVPAAAPFCGSSGVQSIPQASECTTGEAKDYCSRDSPFVWCYPSSCTDDLVSKIAQKCDISNNAAGAHCGRYTRGYCDDNSGGDGYWLNRAKVQGGCDKLNDGDKNVVGRCFAYKGGSTPTNSTSQALPACVPVTSYQPNRCTSSCGDPLTLNLLMNNIKLTGNCATGQCAANIKIDPATPLTIPFAKELADYFTGVLDAEHQKTADIDRLQQDMRQGIFDEALNKAGPARKLLPADIQDQLKCQFVKWVIDRKALQQKNDPNNPGNSRYVNVKTGYEFKVLDTIVTKIECPPPQTSSGYSAWSQKWSDTWLWVPLFDNEESAGKIEFVSGGLYTPKLTPINTSIPEIRRLASVSAILQSALVPKAELPAPKTIGPEIKPFISDLACTRTPTLLELYNGSPKPEIFSDPNYKDKTAYELGVLCQQPTLKSATGSKVCSIGPDGQFNCFEQFPAAELPRNQVKEFDNVVVQTRNVTPYLYDAYLQTTDTLRGVLRIFKPEGNFDQSYEPFPAESEKIKYVLQPTLGGVALAENEQKKSGWRVLFDKLGGIWTARDYVIKLLSPFGAQVENTQIQESPNPIDVAFSAVKTANPSSITDYPGSATITYTLTITPSSSAVTINSVSDEIVRWKGAQPVSLRKTSLDSSKLSQTYTYQISGDDFKDSTVVNTATIVARSTSGTTKILTQTAEARVVIGSPAPPPPPTSDKCPVASDSSPCAVTKLLPYFKNDPVAAKKASQICQAESGAKVNGTPNDSCNRPKNPGTNEYSVGLFQINLFVHDKDLVQRNLCPAGMFTYQYNTPGGTACVRDDAKLAQCRENMTSQDGFPACDLGGGQTDCNIETAARYSNYGQNWGPWSTAPICGIK